MCLAADVAMTMVNRAIELAETKGDSRYYVNSVKLHKLLYLGQYCMLKHYGRPLFEDEITAHYCGPYVEGIQIIPGERGFDLIRDPFPETEFVPPSIIRQDTINKVLEKYGHYSVDEIIDIVKRTKPYEAVKEDITDSYKPPISLSDMTSGDDKLLVS